MNFKEINAEMSTAQKIWEDKNDKERYSGIILEFPKEDKPFDLDINTWPNEEENSGDLMLQKSFKTLKEAKEIAEKFLTLSKNLFKG